MYGEETKKKERFLAGSDIFLGSMLAITVILLVLGLACLFSPNPIAVQPITYTGKVVDATGSTVTVQSGPNDHLTFKRTDQVAVSKCGDLQAWNRIKPGDKVAVSYFDTGKNADFVALSPGATERC